jgi:hypothetical protein
MTTQQRISLMSTWWPDACHAQGWNPQDREKRLEVLSFAVGRQLQSANDLNSTTDVDAVKRHLGSLAENLTAIMDTATAGARRRLVYQIGKLSQQLSSSATPMAYAHTIARDRFGTADIDSLTDDQLTQLRNTLSNRVTARKSKVANSTHSSQESHDDNPF